MKKIVSLFLLLLFIGTLVFFFSCDLIKMTEEEYAEYVLTGKRKTPWQAVGTPATVNSSVSTTTLVSGL
ncbi:MAG TPA: hypothetical protein PLO89_10475, partial [Spirochaetota bacterium]|nr:hypothetical protein [Spirochaetota bacterium]